MDIKLTEIEKVHLYVINRSLLSENDISEIENKIKTDLSFREIAEQVKLIHEEINTSNLSDIDTENILSRVLNKINKCNVFELRPVFPDDEDNDNMKLAAMQRNELNGKLTYFNTYASADKFVLIRVLKNPSNNEYKLFLICEDMNLAGNSVIKFLNNKNEFITDDKGIVTIVSDYLNKDLEIKVFLPSDIFIIELKNLKDSYQSDRSMAKANVRLDNAGKIIEIEFESGFLSDKSVYAVPDNYIQSFLKPEKISNDDIRIYTADKNIDQLKLILIND